jgi:hypothetical protein
VQALAHCRGTDTSMCLIMHGTQHHAQAHCQPWKCVQPCHIAGTTHLQLQTAGQVAARGTPRGHTLVLHTLEDLRFLSSLA